MRLGSFSYNVGDETLYFEEVGKKRKSEIQFLENCSNEVEALFQLIFLVKLDPAEIASKIKNVEKNYKLDSFDFNIFEHLLVIEEDDEVEFIKCRNDIAAIFSLVEIVAIEPEEILMRMEY